MTLICGIPNAGKTTYSQHFDNVVHMDDVASKGKASSRILEIISESTEDMVLEGVFISRYQRKQLVNACKPEWKNTCIWLDTPLDECIRRENRGRKPNLMQNCHACMQPPTLDEGWDEIIIIRGNDEQRYSRQTED